MLIVNLQRSALCNGEHKNVHFAGVKRKKSLLTLARNSQQYMFLFLKQYIFLNGWHGVFFVKMIDNFSSKFRFYLHKANQYLNYLYLLYSQHGYFFWFLRIYSSQKVSILFLLPSLCGVMGHIFAKSLHTPHTILSQLADKEHYNKLIGNIWVHWF